MDKPLPTWLALACQEFEECRYKAPEESVKTWNEVLNVNLFIYI